MLSAPLFIGVYYALARRSAPVLRGQPLLVCRAMSAPATKKIQGEKCDVAWLGEGRGRGICRPYYGDKGGQVMFTRLASE